MTRREYLQQLWDTLRAPNYSDAALEFRPFKGWFIVYDEPSFLGDDGAFIGQNWQFAADEIRYLCPKGNAA